MSKALIAAAVIFVISIIGLIVYLVKSATDTVVSDIADLTTSSQLSSPTADTPSPPAIGTSPPPPADASVITPVPAPSVVDISIITPVPSPAVVDASIVTPAPAPAPVPAPATCDSVTHGPYTKDCLNTWWKAAGCTTDRPLKIDTSWWDARSPADVKADMAAWASTWDSSHIVGCYGVSSSDTLSTGSELQSNNSKIGNTMLTSQNGEYVMILQKDGNLVIYNKTNWNPVWASNTADTRTGILKLAMQNDGNLVIYDSAGAPIWASDTAGKGSNLSLKLNNDGTAMIVNANNALVWLTAPKNIRMVLTKANTFALDSTGGNANGTSPWFYGNDPANKNQTFVYDLSTNAIKWNGKCLDVPGGNANNEQTLQWWDCNNSNAQKWTYDPTTLLWKSALNNKCIDSFGNSKLHNEVKPILYDCSATNENQMWNAPW